MSDISNQLIKDSYNYVLQSDVSTGNIYRIGGGIPVNPIFLSGLTINSSFNFSNGSEQPGYVLTSDSSGNATWSPAGSSSGDYLPLSGGTVSGRTIFTSGLTANTISATTIQTVELVSTLPTQQIVLKTSSGTVSARIFNDSNILRIKSSGSHDTLNIFSTGNLGVNQTTDAGFKLDVNGTARVQGQLTISTGGASIAGTTTISGPIINPSQSGYGVNSNFFSHNSPPFQYSTTYIYQTSNQNSSVATSGSRTSFLDQIGWVQSSGDADFASFRATPVINQTGTATGITRGLYVNPTLTSAADFRAIETTNGKVIFGGTGNVLIGTTVDSGFKLDVNGAARVSGNLNIGLTGGTSNLNFPNTTGGFTNGISSIFAGNAIRMFAGSAFLQMDGSSSISLNGNTTVSGINGNPAFIVNQTNNAWATLVDFRGENVTRFRFLTNGNLLLGTTTDAGYKLDVNGTANFTTARINGVVLALSSQGGGTISSANSAGNNTGPFISLNGPAYLNPTAGNSGIFSIGGQYQSSSGNAIFNHLNLAPTINNTSTYSGTVRGIYYNPTLTSLIGTTHTAIETVTGNVILGSTSGNTLIGTSVDSGYKLDVSGTVRVTGDTTSLTFNASNNGGSYKVQGTNVLDYGNGIRIGYFNGVQKITLYTNAGTPQLTVLNTGNVLIGTTTDAGYKLDVNGNTRITGNLTVSGNTNITGGLTATTISATTYQGVNRSFGVSFDGMGSVITVNSQSTLTIPYNMVIQSWVLLSDVTGSTVIDIWKDTYANYPPTSGDSITSLAKPSIVSGTKNQSSTLTGWNTIVNSGDIIRFNVDSCTGMTKATLTIIGKEF